MGNNANQKDMDDLVVQLKKALAPATAVKPQSFEDVKAGDIVHRLLAGKPMALTVGKVENGIIYAGNDTVPFDDGWRFMASTGGEIDEYLGWDGITSTGSYLVRL